MARERSVTDQERENAVVIEARGVERDHNGLIQIGDRDSEIAWDDWIQGLRESEGTGTVTAFKLPVDAEGNPSQGRGTRQARLGSWPHMLFTLEELSDKIIKGFLKPGETAHVRFVGTQPGTRGTIVQKIVTLSRSSTEPEHENEFASAMKITQEALDRQAQMMERLLVRDVAPQPQRNALISPELKEVLIACMPVVGTIVGALIQRPKPKSDMTELLGALSSMKEFISGESSSKDEDTTLSIVKAVAPGAMQLLTTLAAQRQPNAAPRRVIARPVPGTQPIRLNVPAPAMSQSAVLTPSPSQPAKEVENDPMLAQLAPQLETLAQIAETNADPTEVAKLVLDSVPESFDEKLWELISDPMRFNRLFILAPKLKSHAEWMEKLRVALVAEYTDDLPVTNESEINAASNAS